MAWKTDIERAREIIAPYIRETPVERAPALERSGAQVYLKLDNLQVTGSFKVRGAVHKLLSLSEEARQRGVIAASSGNHGAAVAYAARALGGAASVYQVDDFGNRIEDGQSGASFEWNALNQLTAGQIPDRLDGIGVAGVDRVIGTQFQRERISLGPHVHCDQLTSATGAGSLHALYTHTALTENRHRLAGANLRRLDSGGSRCRLRRGELPRLHHLSKFHRAGVQVRDQR